MYKNLLIYLDDVIVWGSTPAEIAEHVEWICGKLGGAGLRLNGEKCLFLTTRLEMLGHWVQGGYLLP